MSETKITKLIYIFLYEKNKMITSNMNTIQIILSSIFEINNNTKKKKKSIPASVTWKSQFIFHTYKITFVFIINLLMFFLNLIKKKNSKENVHIFSNDFFYWRNVSKNVWIERVITQISTKLIR